MHDAPSTDDLDRPLLETLRYDALTATPSSTDVARVREHATLGAYGPDQLAAVDRNAPKPLTMGLFVGGLFAGIPLIVTLVYLVRGEGDTAFAGLVLTAGIFVVPGALGVIGAVVSRRNRWRRHTRVALFAEANGLGFRPVADAALVPPAVRSAGSPTDVMHADLVTGRVQGQQVSLGVRTSRVTTKDPQETHHLVWAALQLDPLWAGRATGWHRLAARVGELRPDKTEFDLWRDEEWVVVGFTSQTGSLDVVPALMAMIDVALATQNGEAA
ncbi:hypothetical protein C8046_11930 [Serinibacter arcticus]|uniref:Uncharacterized protein n=1 Tax=Serinibacter arcticus TaxID=1655435 RepID=A0A2U1ZWA1_9MICO|nr:hypothetical protein [Serinibacter arcticus]PWD51258.1 hypothetical protein C8046_11930 [Serinibacter arcticus]